MSTSASCRSDQWTEIFENMISPAVVAAGDECRRSAGLAGNIIKLILDDLNRADLVIADLTDRNPNVFYELGVRHALRDTTALITQSLDDVPFDLRPYSVISYDWTTEQGRSAFTNMLRACLGEMANRPASGLSPVRTGTRAHHLRRFRKIRFRRLAACGADPAQDLVILTLSQ